MSKVYLARFKVKDRKITNSEDICEGQNSHGFKPRIWSAIAELYDSNNLFTAWQVKKEFWRLAESETLPLLHRLAFGLSFDFGYFKTKDIPKITEALKSLDEAIKTIDGNKKIVNHLQMVIGSLNKENLNDDFYYYFYDSINEDFFADEYYNESDEVFPNSLDDLLGQGHDAWDIVDTWRKDNNKKGEDK